MTKVGEGSSYPIPHKPEEELKKSTSNFKKYLDEFHKAEEQDSKQHAIDRMGTEMTLMDVAGQSASKKEVRVQEGKVSDDFKAFQEDPSESNSQVLQHDLNTLRESLEH